MDLASIRSDPLPHLALVDISFMPEADLKRCVQRCSRLGLPVILLVPETQLVDLDVDLGVNDFVVSPPNARELVTRARRVLLRTKSPEDSDTVRIGDLAINPTRYEVSLKGRRINPQVQGVRAAAASGCKPRQGLYEGGAPQPDMGLRTTSAGPARWTYTSGGCAVR